MLVCYDKARGAAVVLQIEQKCRKSKPERQEIGDMERNKREEMGVDGAREREEVMLMNIHTLEGKKPHIQILISGVAEKIAALLTCCSSNRTSSRPDPAGRPEGGTPRSLWPGRDPAPQQMHANAEQLPAAANPPRSYFLYCIIERALGRAGRQIKMEAAERPPRPYTRVWPKHFLL